VRRRRSARDDQVDGDGFAEVAHPCGETLIGQVELVRDDEAAVEIEPEREDGDSQRESRTK
jgi:hypothetical protein